MSAVACSERDQMILRRGKCSVSRHSLLMRLCGCSNTIPESHNVPDGATFGAGQSLLLLCKPKQEQMEC